MTQIKRLYASSGPEVIIETLQITIGSDVHYLCQGYESITATTENGDTVTFTRLFDRALRCRRAMRTARRTSNLPCVISMCCVHGDPQCDGYRLSAFLTYRRYISPDLAAPCGSAVYAENQIGLLDGDRGADHCGLHEYPRYRLAAIPLHAPVFPDCVISAKESQCLTLINTVQSPG